MTKKQKYLNSEAHGYLLESDACALLIKELERVCTKFQRRIDKENATRQADFDAAMEYHSENEIQDAYGWELITEAQYHAYMDLFHRGRQALEEHAPPYLSWHCPSQGGSSMIWSPISVSLPSLLSHQNSRLPNCCAQRKLAKSGKNILPG